jgi:hypothetical protein
MDRTFFDLPPEKRAALTLEARAAGKPLAIRWDVLEPSFGQGWRYRLLPAAKMLRAAATVADIGCGAMALEGYLSEGQTYLPIDLAARDDRTVVIDLNDASDLARLPSADACATLGVLEYCYDADAVVEALGSKFRQAVVSYNVAPAGSDPEDRLSRGWTNQMTLGQIEVLFKKHGFNVRKRIRVSKRRDEWLFNLRVKS